jgi:hypothetical protein
VIGVVIIRGGGGGVDHCDPRTDRRPTNGPIGVYPGMGPPPLGRGGSIGRTMPPRGTFPQR